MAIREIVLLGDPILRERAREVETFDDELRELVEDMFETMYHAEGVGLAAPQIGIGRRVFVVDTRDEEDDHGGRVALINPEIVAVSDETDREIEGCLSIPGLEESVERPVTIEIRGLDPRGEEVSFTAETLFARALQHELDHLDGVLFLDRISPLKRRMLLKKWRKLQAEEV